MRKPHEMVEQCNSASDRVLRGTQSLRFDLDSVSVSVYSLPFRLSIFQLFDILFVKWNYLWALS